MTPQDKGRAAQLPTDETTRILPAGSFDLPEGGGRGQAAPPGTLLNDFELIRVIGEGGFGVVYEAIDRALLRHVALKEYMPANLVSRKDQTQIQVRSPKYQEAFDLGMRSFVNEARLLVRFDHPSLVKAFSFWEANGTAYMVMPLYKGSTLKETLKQLESPPTQDWILSLLDPLTGALQVLHAENCYHRDIAPDNILLLEDSGRPVLIDFGAARQVIGDLTQSLTAILKPGFAPIEQYGDTPEMVQGAWTDIYALAATMHFAITGSTPPAAVGRLIKDSYVPLATRGIRGYSPRVLAALDRALGVRPSDRTSSMAELRADLGLPPPNVGNVLVHGERRDNESSPRPGRLRSFPVRSRWLLAVGGLSLLGACVAAAGLWWQGAGHEPTASVSPSPQALPVPQTPPLTLPSVETAVTPQPVASAPTTFDVSAEFRQIVANQTPGFDIEASADKPVLKIGKDRFGWRLRSARDGFVHILGLGSDGSLFLVFPNSQDAENRIRAGQTLHLPRQTWPLEAAEPAGREELLIVVSTQPRGFAGLVKERVNYFYQLPTGNAALSAQASWPHRTSWLLGSVANCAGQQCENYGATTVSVEVRH